ncbi:MAG: glycosyltransferase [Acidobacteriota bacterium]
MKALIVTQRFPWPPHTGDRLRATTWLSALGTGWEITLIAPDGRVPAGVPLFRFQRATWSLLGCLRGTLAVIGGRVPLQCLLAAPYNWRGAIARARREAGRFDVTVILLSRMHPWVREALEGRTILDAIDSLRRNAEERRRASGWATRWLWGIEERRMTRLECEETSAYERVVVVSEEETCEFGRSVAVAVPVGVPVAPLGVAPRTFDFGFWGRLPYFANADAVNWLLEEIWPAIRALRPQATLVIGGAGAPRSLRAEARRQGVTLVSPIDDIASFGRDIRVALMPLRYGSGQSTKVLEAAEAGCAIVGTPEAMRGLAPIAALARIETSAPAFARAAVELFDDDRREHIVTQLREVVDARYSRSATLLRLAAIARAAGDR